MIAVTGANGLLGSFIVRKLAEENKEFVAIQRKGSDTSLLGDLKHSIKWREADVCDPVTLTEVLADVTTVIHAAAMVSFNPREEKKMFEVNVSGTRNVVNVCLQNNVKRFIQISSVAALGRQKDKTTIDESNKWADSALNSAYGKSKYLAEQEVFRGQEEGLSTLIINPSVILAPANWHKSSAQLFHYVWRERPYYFNGYMNFVDVRDVVDITYSLLHSDCEAEKFIVSAGTISYKELFDKIANHLNKKSPSFRIDKNFLRIISKIEEARSLILGVSPLITRESTRLAGTNILCDNKKVKKKLNFEFKPIDTTLQWCCEYYLRQVNAEK